MIERKAGLLTAKKNDDKKREKVWENSASKEGSNETNGNMSSGYGKENCFSWDWEAFFDEEEKKFAFQIEAKDYESSSTYGNMTEKCLACNLEIAFNIVKAVIKYYRKGGFWSGAAHCGTEKK